MGLVLNRPSETTVGEAVPELADVAGADSPSSWAGRCSRRPCSCSPSSTSRRRRRRSSSATSASRGPTATSTTSRGRRGAPASLPATRAGRRASSSRSSKRTRGSSSPSDDIDLLADAEDDLFGAALRTKGGTYRILALMPDDPRTELGAQLLGRQRTVAELGQRTARGRGRPQHIVGSIGKRADDLRALEQHAARHRRDVDGELWLACSRARRGSRWPPRLGRRSSLQLLPQHVADELRVRSALRLLHHLADEEPEHAFLARRGRRPPGRDSPPARRR